MNLPAGLWLPVRCECGSAAGRRPHRRPITTEFSRKAGSLGRNTEFRAGTAVPGRTVFRRGQSAAEALDVAIDDVQPCRVDLHLENVPAAISDTKLGAAVVDLHLVDDPPEIAGKPPQGLKGLSLFGRNVAFLTGESSGCRQYPEECRQRQCFFGSNS